MCRLPTAEPERASTSIPPHHATQRAAHPFSRLSPARARWWQNRIGTAASLQLNCYHQSTSTGGRSIFRATILNSEGEHSGCLTLLFKCIAVIQINAELAVRCARPPYHFALKPLAPSPCHLGDEMIDGDKEEASQSITLLSDV